MPETDTIRLLLVDDHKVVRNGLRVFLSLYDDIEVVGEAKDGRQALEQCAAHQPDVVLMDMAMPVMDGPTATRLVREQFPQIEVIALTSFEDAKLINRQFWRFSVGTTELAWDFQRGPIPQQAHGLFAQVCFLPSHYLQTFKETI